MIKKILILLCGILCVGTLQAAEQIKVCGKYQRADSSWSHGYKLTGFKLNGNELGEALFKNRFKFNLYEYYFLLLWDNGGYTYYKVPNYFPMLVGNEVEDQNGRRWIFDKGWNSCY